MAPSDTADAPAVFGRLRTTASHTIGVPHLADLLREGPRGTDRDAYRAAVVEGNAMGRPTHAGRLRTYRHLRELYFLDPEEPQFRALRALWVADHDALPLLAGLLAFTRDELLRASWPAIARATPGSVVSSEDLSHVVAETYAGTLSAATIGKIGRNTGSCWSQTGHLVGRAKTRARVDPRPAAIAYAAYLGSLDGGRALGVLDNPWSALLDLPDDARLDALRRAHDAGLVDLQVRVRRAGPR